MTGTVLVFNPTAPRVAASMARASSVGNLSDKVVGFLDNAKPNFSFLVEDLTDLLVSRHGVSGIVKRRKRGPTTPAPDALLADLADRCDLVITGSGD